MLNIAIYLGSKIGKYPVFSANAQQLGKELALNGYTIIYGGTSIGTMGILANSALEAGGKVIGVFPDNFKGKHDAGYKVNEIAHTSLTNMHLVKDMQERKKLMEELSDCCVIFPGGFGTMDEMFEYGVNRQIGYHNKPILVLNINDYYTPLKQQIINMVDNGFMPKEDLEAITFYNTIEELIASLKLL